MSIRDTSNNTTVKTMSNLSNGVGISISLPLAIESTKMSISSISSISKTMSIGDTGDNATVKSMSNLSNGVGISISLPLTIVSTKMAISSISKTMAIGDTGDDSNIVSTARSNSMGNGKSMSNLSNGVGLCLTLAIVSIMSVSNSSSH